MGSKTQIQVVGLCLPVANCAPLALCLLDCWTARTVNHTTLAFGNIVRIDSVNLPVSSVGCLESIPTVSCSPCGNVYPAPPAGARTVKGCRYTIEIDLDQFLDNPETEEPWTPVAADVCEINPYACSVTGLIAAQLLTNLDCTLERDSESGAVGIPATAEYDPEADSEVNDANTAVEFLGFNDTGCSVRVRTAAAARQMTEASTSLSTFAENTQKIIDFDGFLFDTLNPVPDLLAPFLIVPGADCHIVFPIAGTYEIFAQVQFALSDWGHQGTDTFAAVQLFSKLNSDTAQQIGSTTVSGYDTTDQQSAPAVSGFRRFVVAAGDEMRLYALHTDTEYGAVHAMSAGGSMGRLEIAKVH